ncbi:hypothetical protein LS70_001080 [Helicobacter sp. MIT 11-5569]|uniref:DUF3800 domain-containing protein n=1 Tax=Helicobacter sp. MIT 11-5569 TaxID=1548151 RepID=UPI00051FCE35|nr:DUF3800 domain-containing protein [Helicobacter sp. MIT 11-5569]TLD85174.1 hypothetical protein LS70_001080 [Helicobacter sp. MIT 11-5569]
MEHNFLLFVDETGTLSRDKNQPLFGLGALKLKETSGFLEKIYSLKQQWNRKKEFKFNEIRYYSDVNFYKELINVCFEHRGFNFYAFFISKTKIVKNETTIWELQMNFLKQHIKENCSMPNEKVCVLADYLSKPNSIPSSFEKTICKMPQVFNASMLESESSTFIQIVDILIGAIAYKNNFPNSKTEKMKFCLYLEEKLQEKSNESHSKEKFCYKNLENNFIINYKGNFYFSLYKK